MLVLAALVAVPLALASRVGPEPYRRPHVPLQWEQHRAVAQAVARGVLQTLPSTREYVENVLAGKPIAANVDGDVEVGVRYLKHLLDAFQGDERLALAGWYQGERAVKQYGIYKVSKPFVANVLALRTRM